MEPKGEVEERETKKQLAKVNEGGDERERQASTGNSWRDSHKTEMDTETMPPYGVLCPP